MSDGIRDALAEALHDIARHYNDTQGGPPMTDRPTTEAGRDRGGSMMMHNAGRHDVGCKWSRPGIIDASVDPCTCDLAEDIATIESALIDELVAAVEKEPNPFDEGSEFVTEFMQAHGFEKGRASVLRILEGARHGK